MIENALARCMETPRRASGRTRTPWLEYNASVKSRFGEGVPRELLSQSVLLWSVCARIAPGVLVYLAVSLNIPQRRWVAAPTGQVKSMDEEFITIQEAGELLGGKEHPFSRFIIKRLIAAGRLQDNKARRKLHRILRSSVEALI